MRKNDKIYSENELSEIRKNRAVMIAEVIERYNAMNNYADADVKYMMAALEFARIAAGYDDVPVGCVIARMGEIIAAGCNSRELYGNALAHAEIEAISSACHRLGGWRLTGCRMYVTLEPCPMCAGAVWSSRIDEVIVGTKDAKSGAMGSLININSYPLNFKSKVRYGVLEDECRRILREYFVQKRQK